MFEKENERKRGGWLYIEPDDEGDEHEEGLHRLREEQGRPEEGSEKQLLRRRGLVTGGAWGRGVCEQSLLCLEQPFLPGAVDLLLFVMMMMMMMACVSGLAAVVGSTQAEQGRRHHGGVGHHDRYRVHTTTATTTSLSVGLFLCSEQDRAEEGRVAASEEENRVDADSVAPVEVPQRVVRLEAHRPPGQVLSSSSVRRR